MGIDEESGRRLGGYRLGDVIGRGGMGVVYRATHVHLRRDVALKLLAPQLGDTDAFRERFLRESRIAASVDHPNVITVYDAGDDDGTLYIAMQYIEGTDLAHLLHREGRLDPERALRLLDQVAWALDTAHRHGLVHRDVKPANVLIAADHCYLTDFGLTKRTGGRDATAVLTQTGQFLGTLDYVAPEQIQGVEIDSRADVYALTCMLHECLTGARPFPKDSDLAIITAHLRDPAPRPTELRPELPGAIDDVVAKGMAKSPSDRYSTSGELLAAARAALTGDTRPGTPTVAASGPGPSVTVSDVPGGPPTLRATGGPLDGTFAETDPARPVARLRPGRRRLTAGVALLCAAGVAIAVVLLVSGGGSSGKQHGKAATPPAGRAGGHPAAVAATVAARVVGTPIRVGKGPVGIAGNSKILWVANFDGSSVTRVSTDGTLRTDISLPPGPFGVFNIGPTFWVSSAEAGVVTPINVATGSPGPPIPVGRHPEFITGDQNGLYVSDARADRVTLVDPRADKVIGAPIPVGGFPRGIAFTGTAVWVADFASNNLDRIVGNQVIKRFPVGRSPVGVAVGDNAVWVANSGDDTVTRLDLLHDTLKTIRVGRRPFAIAFGLGSAWVTNSDDNTVTRLDGATGAPVGAPIPVGNDPSGVAVIGGFVWVTNRGSDTVEKIQP